ncbi:hypothetical protein VTI74DRAFT_2647 [Chaetomium olivicolor]
MGIGQGDRHLSQKSSMTEQTSGRACSQHSSRRSHKEEEERWQKAWPFSDFEKVPGLGLLRPRCRDPPGWAERWGLVTGERRLRPRGGCIALIQKCRHLMNQGVVATAMTTASTAELAPFISVKRRQAQAFLSTGHRLHRKRKKSQAMFPGQASSCGDTSNVIESSRVMSAHRSCEACPEKLLWQLRRQEGNWLEPSMALHV